MENKQITIQSATVNTGNLLTELFVMTKLVAKAYPHLVKDGKLTVEGAQSEEEEQVWNSIGNIISRYSEMVFEIDKGAVLYIALEFAEDSNSDKPG